MLGLLAACAALIIGALFWRYLLSAVLVAAILAGSALALLAAVVALAAMPHEWRGAACVIGVVFSLVWIHALLEKRDTIRRQVRAYKTAKKSMQ
jgi:hypothetical protein